MEQMGFNLSLWSREW